MVCFKQKTAYEMRISDWSSDVCSSDLLPWCLGQDIHQKLEALGGKTRHESFERRAAYGEVTAHWIADIDVQKGSDEPCRDPATAETSAREAVTSTAGMAETARYHEIVAFPDTAEHLRQQRHVMLHVSVHNGDDRRR